jgi:protein-L-isoaspartate(D-aspartate) O-methyltransferase
MIGKFSSWPILSGLISLGLTGCTAEMPPFDVQRAAMVGKIRTAAEATPQIIQHPHYEPALKAIGTVPRHDFVTREAREFAYLLTPLKIGYSQTISDPFVVAVMTIAAAVRPGSNVLEVGTGSGYQAAVLAQIGASVHSIEIVPPLAKTAAHRLQRMGYKKVTVKEGDGFMGWPDFAPYDAIIVTAAAAEIPAPLIAQLKIGGHLVMPIGPDAPLEQLIRVTKGADGKLDQCSLGPTMFVPLTGKGQRASGEMGLYDRSIPSCFGAENRP